MAAWNQRQARFALHYQTHLTVVRRIGSSRVDGRGAGVSACFVVRRVAIRIRWFGIQIAAVCSHDVAHRFQKFESSVDVVVEPTETGLDPCIVDDVLALLRAANRHSPA